MSYSIPKKKKMANDLKTTQNQSISHGIKMHIQILQPVADFKEATSLVDRSTNKTVKNTSSITHCTFIKIQCDHIDDNKTK